MMYQVVLLPAEDWSFHCGDYRAGWLWIVCTMWEAIAPSGEKGCYYSVQREGLPASYSLASADVCSMAAASLIQGVCHFKMEPFIAESSRLEQIADSEYISCEICLDLKRWMRKLTLASCINLQWLVLAANGLSTVSVYYKSRYVREEPVVSVEMSSSKTFSYKKVFEWMWSWSSCMS